MDIQAVFDALADPTRRRILAMLVREGELCVCELTAGLADIQPKISRHLAVLKDAGIVVARRDATWMFYRLDATLPAWVAALLEILPRGAVPEGPADLRRLTQMPARPERCAA